MPLAAPRPTASRHAFKPFALCLGALLLAVRSAPAGDAVLIRVDESQKPVVVELTEGDLARPAPHAGLLIWADADGEERWQVIPKGWTLAAQRNKTPDRPGAATGTRGARSTGGGTMVAQLSTQLDQLRASGLVRPGEVNFLTPPEKGQLLNPKITLRRFPAKERSARPPAATAVLKQASGAKKELARIPFKEGQMTARWDDIPNLPPALAKGLPAGEYVLELEKGRGTPILFTVLEKGEQRDRAEAPVRKFAELTGGTSDPVYLLFALEHLLDQTDDDGVPVFLADALGLLDSAPAAALTSHLKEQHKRLVEWLSVPAQERAKAVALPPAPGDPTKIPEVDRARALIAAGQWAQALKELNGKALLARAAKDARARGLADLYRGVILSEAGQGKEEEAMKAFGRAIEALEKAGPADRLRAHNNAGDFQLNLAQDCLYNHAFQMAAGVKAPILKALRLWNEARANYEAALGLAEGAGQGGHRAAIRVNLARLYTLLADVIRTVDADRQFAQGERAADQAAEALAAEVGNGKGDEPLVRGVAAELRAQLALRTKDLPAARKHADEALAAFLQGGYLAGVENVQRLLGLLAGSPKDALRHFQTAQAISEALRERLPFDRVGVTRAGFFARKAWVNEKIVEILIQEGRDAEALEFAELAKARALQDLFLADRGSRKEDADAALSVAELLARWPEKAADAAALEYFLGGERAWVFVVGPSGKVKAHELKDEAGAAVRSRALVARVQRFLRDIEGYAPKMLNRYLSGKGYDHAWQDELHALYKTLIPAEAMAEVRRAKRVVVVPQHVLHYFPFAALVTETDQGRGPKQMVKPKFLLDEKFDLSYAPSLTTWGLSRLAAAPAARQVNAVGLVEAPGADPLPGVTEDLKNLKRHFGKHIRVLFEEDKAREENVKKLLGERGLLFVATHGFNDADRPLDSFLILLGDAAADKADAEGADEGRLTAREIFHHKVGADLVVMSACYSGLGDRSPMPGDDLYGLQRAFLQSGARTVVSGLWDVYDGSAPELMGRFFGNLAKGEPAAAALARAQRAFLDRLRSARTVEPWLHPYFWAVYTCAGDDRTVVAK